MRALSELYVDPGRDYKSPSTWLGRQQAHPVSGDPRLTAGIHEGRATPTRFQTRGAAVSPNWCGARLGWKNKVGPNPSIPEAAELIGLSEASRGAADQR